MWLQEEEYNEFVKGLHWISLCGKGLSKLKVSTKVSIKGVCYDWTKNVLRASPIGPLLRPPTPQ
jgi:hypothetical protein